MKRASQSALSVESLLIVDQYMHLLQRMENLSMITMHNYHCGFQQFIARCECCWREDQYEQPFTSQEVPPPLLIRYRTYLQTVLCGRRGRNVAGSCYYHSIYAFWTKSKGAV